MKMIRLRVPMVMGTVLLLLLDGAGAAATDTDDLVAALVNVPAAEMYQYQTRDDQGRSMDCLKVFQVGDGDYRGLYHGFHVGVSPSVWPIS